jgi:hypothetical protein
MLNKSQSPNRIKEGVGIKQIRPGIIAGSDRIRNGMICAANPIKKNSCWSNYGCAVLTPSHPGMSKSAQPLRMQAQTEFSWLSFIHTDLENNNLSTYVLAQKLAISAFTFCNLLSGAYQCLVVSTRTAAIMPANQLGLLANTDGLSDLSKYIWNLRLRLKV